MRTRTYDETTDNTSTNGPVDFTKDQFTLRRSGSSEGSYGNPYDPESLLTGEEEAKGFTYTNSTRVWVSQALHTLAVQGKLTTEEVLAAGPRQLKSDNTFVEALTDILEAYAN